MSKGPRGEKRPADFVQLNHKVLGENGSCENDSKNIWDLIGRGKERVEKEAFDRLKAELDHAFAALESSYVSLAAAEIIARNQM